MCAGPLFLIGCSFARYMLDGRLLRHTVAVFCRLVVRLAAAVRIRGERMRARRRAFFYRRDGLSVGFGCVHRARHFGRKRSVGTGIDAGVTEFCRRFLHSALPTPATATVATLAR